MTEAIRTFGAIGVTWGCLIVLTLFLLDRVEQELDPWRRNSAIPT